jgi:hypothetical protein
LLYKVVAQVIKEWTSTSNTSNSNDVQLSPGKFCLFKLFKIIYFVYLAAYFLNGSPHLIEPMAPRQPTFNVMPRRITNEDFYRALEQTNRAAATTTTATTPRPSNIPTQQAPRTSNRRNLISMDQLRNVLQRASAPVTTMENTASEPANVQELLDQMIAMGLTDEAANRQALEATNWDLKAALDFLLG